MDVEILSRIQFAFTVAFHYLYPPLSIGLGVILVIMEAMWLKTGHVRYHNMARYWTRIFGLTFAIGVASGIVMEFEFGTNWAAYSRFVGDVFGSALAAEGIFAFFLESGFLAILLFGWNKVGPKLHFFSTLMVCLGAHFSAVWIVVANSWMQTPAGFSIEYNGEIMPPGFVPTADQILHSRAVIHDFWAMVFNPSSMDRLSHVLVGAWQTGAFLVVGISAFYLLRGRHKEFAASSLKIGLCVAAVASLLQLATGAKSADGVTRNQPAKLAAMEGIFKTQTDAPMSVAGWVNTDSQEVIGLKIPGMLSYLVGGSTETVVKGLDAFPAQEWPPVQPVFQFYHIMIAIGMALIGVAWLGIFLWWRGWLFETANPLVRAYYCILVLSVLGPQVANQAGWFTAEMGRQPWIVYGLMRTSQGLSEVVAANHVLASLIMFSLIYALLFAVFLYLLARKIQRGPDNEEDSETMPESWIALMERRKGQASAAG
ncbi:MAG: cytochrome ubiquinol oxidase subunit I [Chthoniobacterales bacterium]|nr:cytochrome ubiquinol oxidase subunit I [Chthoniobacterales bacterium]